MVLSSNALGLGRWEQAEKALQVAQEAQAQRDVGQTARQAQEELARLGD